MVTIKKLREHWNQLEWIQKVVYLYVVMLIVSSIVMYHYSKSEADAVRKQAKGKGPQSTKMEETWHAYSSH